MSRSTRSIRRTLQSTSLLAVIAGYMVLLVANYWLANYQRAQAHLQRLSLLQAYLQRFAANPRQLDLALGRTWSPDFEIQHAKEAFSVGLPIAELRKYGGREWLESVIQIRTASGLLVYLKVKEDVSKSVQREWLSQMLLIAAAGVSSLVTSALLRPVLRAGLMRPLRQLMLQLDATHAPPSGGAHLPAESQPQELQSIAQAFNQLQDRIALSWQREREFVDGVAHELRTPITLMSGYAQSLLRQPLEPKLRESVSRVASEARRMESLVSALLALARQDAGRLQLESNYFDPRDQLIQAYERLQPTSESRLELCGLDSLPDQLLVCGDPDRLQQCLAALVDNALIYSDPPLPVALSLSSADGFVVFHVSDQGPGVSDREKLTIFERFVRGSCSLGVRGSGIGLAVVKQLMLLMNGWVDVVDVDGGGSDFRLHFPMAPSVKV